MEDGLPTHGLTNRQLKLSYWYITHKLTVRKWLAVLLAVLTALLWFYIIWQLAFFIKDYNANNSNLRQLLFGANIALPKVESQKPQPPNISEIQVLGGENNLYDFIAQITNSNKNWLLTFDYKFADNNASSSARKGFVLPGEQKFLMDLGHADSQAKLEITNQVWQHLNNPQQVIDKRLRFEITDPVFHRMNQAGEPSRATFTVQNASAYGYWEVGVPVFLYSSGNLVAVNYLTLSQLASGEKRPVEVYWNYPIGGVDEVQVIPEVNVFDEDNIMPPGTASLHTQPESPTTSTSTSGSVNTVSTTDNFNEDFLNSL